jgi:hypothetical protein
MPMIITDKGKSAALIKEEIVASISVKNVVH